MSKCKYCNTEITWAKQNDKNVPLNTDNSVHRCRTQNTGPTLDAGPTTRTMTNVEENLIRALIEFIRQEAGKK